jgi:death-on-curing protein
MEFRTLTPGVVEALHDAALNPGEPPGRALDKSLEGALSRVDNRLAYGLVEDIFDLAAAYCVALAQGYGINDGNKRTAFSRWMPF